MGRLRANEILLSEQMLCELDPHFLLIVSGVS
jgi:hypothetical protein